MSSNNIHSFGTVFNLKLTKLQNGKLMLLVTNGNKKRFSIIDDGGSVSVNLM